MATYSSILAWRIPWMEEPGGATIYGITKSRRWLSNFTFTIPSLAGGKETPSPHTTHPNLGLIHHRGKESTSEAIHGQSCLFIYNPTCLFTKHLWWNVSVKVSAFHDNQAARWRRKTSLLCVTECWLYDVLCCAWLLSCVQLFATPQTVACQTPLSMGILLQESWSGLLCPPPKDLPNSGIEPRSPTLQVNTIPSEPAGVFDRLLKKISLMPSMGAKRWKDSTKVTQRSNHCQKFDEKWNLSLFFLCDLQWNVAKKENERDRKRGRKGRRKKKENRNKGSSAYILFLCA